MKTSTGGTVSFKKRGRIDAGFIRLETTNVVLLAMHGEYLVLPANSFSDPDCAYLRKASGMEDSEAGCGGQSSMVRNEMSRRRREAAGLREQAASTRNLFGLELAAADQLDHEAAGLSRRATRLKTQAQALSQKRSADDLNGPTSTSSSAEFGSVRVKGDASIVTSAAKQLEQDAAKLRSHAQEKRQNAMALSKKAADLEETAQSIESSLGLAAPVTSPSLSSRSAYESQ